MGKWLACREESVPISKANQCTCQVVIIIFSFVAIHISQKKRSILETVYWFSNKDQSLWVE